MKHSPSQSAFLLAGVVWGISLWLSPSALEAQSTRLTVDVDRPGHKVSPTLWGIFFEDINLSADGGIYPELVRNRSFEDAEKPEYWTLANTGGAKAEMATDTSRPLNPMNRRSLRWTIENLGAGASSVSNPGYWGMSVVAGEDYHFSAAVRCDGSFTGPLKVALENEAGQSLAAGQVEGFGDAWRTFTLTITAGATDPKAHLVIRTAHTGTVWLDMVSLMPAKTWKGHGLRTDLSEMLNGLKPAFVRFPGGCWVEGDDMAHMYHWKNTIGNIAERKPLWNIWGYNATHGLGFHEYLQMCEDLGAEPLFCINVGMSHHEVIPLDQMGQWVQDALDAIEYANGPTESVWGGIRARNGHPAPFHLKYMEIGNENGGPAYAERYALFYHAIKAKYPDMHLIADVWGGIPQDSPVEIVDEHYYSNPEFFISQANRYDSYKRDGVKVFVGEYAVTQGCGQGDLRGAVGEAAFMTGMERNSDVVLMASYAPLFVNVNHKRWNPDLIDFDSSRVFGIPSYYVQKMFSENRGDVVLPVTVDAADVDTAPKGGEIGVGTWLTQAEFKDIKVTHDGETLFSSDFANGTQGWKKLGGDWKVEDGALRQTGGEDNVRAIVTGQRWTNYTYSLKARKLGGAEGFLILFNVNDENAKSWWNIGGWGNSHSAVEMDGVVGNEVPGGVETGRWYDIRIEVNGKNIRCYLDGKLMHDVNRAATKPIYASATRVDATGEVILKVVNVAADALTTEIKLNGAGRLADSAQTIVLTSDKPTDENSLENPTKVSPVTSEITVNGDTIRHSFPGNSVTVLRIKPAK